MRAAQYPAHDRPRAGTLPGAGARRRCDDTVRGPARAVRQAKACPFAFAWNYTGWPALSLPAGFTRSGLPIGAQLLGREGDEATLLQLATQLEQVETWTRHAPPLTTDD